MAAVNWTQEDIDALRAALASGVKRIRKADGSEVEYQSARDIEAAIAKIQQALNAAAGITSSVIRVSVSKGY
jgi:stage III sporulation protein SpoIIIAA